MVIFMLGATLMLGFLLDIARPRCLSRVNFPSILTNSFWFCFECGFLFFLLVVILILFGLLGLVSGLPFIFGVDGMGGEAACLQTGLGVAQLGVCSVWGWWWYIGLSGYGTFWALLLCSLLPHFLLGQFDLAVLAGYVAQLGQVGGL